ncbi:glycosyltransferase family 4 protein [Magnetofaba australis]|uniref:Putative group 1 glycosyl transferase n=1 Tax=Magnetofaba australis IT-1 TaxID=1434232 RepID=A0A1Y2JYS4_9PROT|nr:glycosyltransferase family 4 protein [Magnetofaba australis]OSM00036.1 putative group 1 glycosyl transferase [Magnetofaba australis IT-1]
MFQKIAYVIGLELNNNRRAHAVQIMKNAQAWANAAQSFEFVVNVFPATWRAGLDPEQLAQFYGLQRPFPMRAFPFYHWEYERHGWLMPVFYHVASWYCRLRGFDLIFSRNYNFPRYAIARGIPTIMEGHNVPAREPERSNFLRATQDPRMLGVVTISQPLADGMIAAGVPAHKMIVEPDGVDLERFANPLDRRAAREKLGLNPARPLAVYCGHLYEKRGVEEIFEAAKRLPHVDFLLVGGMDSDLAKRRREIEHLKLENVLFSGFVENGRIPDYLWAADVLLMPYSREGATAEWMSPMKMFEYMAAGRVILSSDLPALRTVLRHGENAWLVAPDSGPALAEGMAALLDDSALAQRLAAKALEEIPQYAWQARVARILAFAKEQARQHL